MQHVHAAIEDIYPALQLVSEVSLLMLYCMCVRPVQLVTIVLSVRIYM